MSPNFFELILAIWLYNAVLTARCSRDNQTQHKENPVKLFQRNPLALLLLAVIGALVLFALGLDSVVDTTGTLIGLVPLFAPDSEPHDEHH